MSNRKIRILVFSSTALCQAIRHLFQDREEFEIVGQTGSVRRLTGKPIEPVPALIIANLKPVRTGICAATLAIKHSNPLAKLILICPVTELNQTGRRCGADACLEPEEVFSRLPRIASELSRARNSELKTRTGV